MKEKPDVSHILSDQEKSGYSECKDDYQNKKTPERIKEMIEQRQNFLKTTREGEAAEKIRKEIADLKNELKLLDPERE